MPGKRSTVRQIREILRLHHEAHLGERQIAAVCLVGKGTVQRFLQRAAAVGLGWPLPEGLDDTATGETAVSASANAGGDQTAAGLHQSAPGVEVQSQRDAAVAVGGIQGGPTRRRQLQLVLRSVSGLGAPSGCGVAAGSPGRRENVRRSRRRHHRHHRSRNRRSPGRLHLRGGAGRQQLHLRRGHLDTGSDGLDRLPYPGAAVLPGRHQVGGARSVEGGCEPALLLGAGVESHLPGLGHAQRRGHSSSAAQTCPGQDLCFILHLVQTR